MSSENIVDQVEEEIKYKDRSGHRRDELTLRALYLLIYEIRELRKDIKELKHV